MYKFKKIIWGNINTSSVENMQALFGDCNSLTTIINLSKFDTASSTIMGYMFYDCWNLKYLDLSNFDTSKVTSVEYMFYGCRSLLYLNLYSFKLNNTMIKT